MARVMLVKTSSDAAAAASAMFDHGTILGSERLDTAASRLQLKAILSTEAGLPSSSNPVLNS